MLLDITSVDFKTQPDYRYHSPLFAKLINKMMKCGKKAIAEKIVYGAFENLESMIKEKKIEVKMDGVVRDDISATELLLLIVSKVATGVEVVTQRVGGANYKIPKPISLKRSLSLAFSWIAQSIASRSEKTAIDKMTNEFIDILNDRGNSIKKKNEIEKNAEANRAFAHFLRR